MAYRASSFLALLLISHVLLVTTWQAVAGCNIHKNSNSEDKKEPQWFFKGGVHIPGIGRAHLPPPNYGLTPQTPYPGGAGGGSTGAGAGSGPSGHSYVPGGDDTFVPNPGFEVPNPGSGGGVPGVHP